MLVRGALALAQKAVTTQEEAPNRKTLGHKQNREYQIETDDFAKAPARESSASCFSSNSNRQKKNAAAEAAA
jgi:hypothetical protein